MKNISGYIFNFCFLAVPFVMYAQQQQTADTLALPVVTESYGIRVGTDLNRLARNFYEKDYRGFEATGDYRLTKKLYAAAEIGTEKKTVDDAQLNFTTSGSYIKFGADYNMHENWPGLRNMIYLGFRYSISTFSQTLNSYQIYDNTGYFGETVIYPNREYSGLSSQWLEVIAGVKAEVLPNVYMGFSLRLHSLTSNKKPDGFDNLFIPGFNRTYDGNVGTSFNYTVSYFIPFYKKTQPQVIKPK